MSSQPLSRHEQDHIALQLIGLAAAAAIAATLVYLLISAQTLLACGRVAPLVPALSGALHLPAHLGDPQAAFTQDIAGMLPSSPIVFWLLTALPLVAMLATVVWVVVRVDRFKAREHLAVRWYDPRSRVTPRAFAVGRDLKHLNAKAADSWTTIRLDRRTIGTAPETHMLLIAPTGSGKTTGPVTTWTLEHTGPLIVTSTKTDIAHLTHSHRAQHGPVWIYAPGVTPAVLPGEPCGWTPLDGCTDWEHAQMTGHWLASATPTRDESGGARFYNKEASRLLAPLLHAAALTGADMATVNHWLRSETPEVSAILDRAGATHARQQLDASRRMEARARSLTIASAGQLIDAYELASIQASDHHDFTADKLLDTGGTLYLIAPEDRQERIAPLFAALLGSILRTVEHRALTQPLDPQLRVVLDETRRLAALDQLPGLLSVSRGWGVRIATVWQNLDQITDRYGRQAHEILTNSNAQLFLGPIRDQGTRDYLTALLGTHRQQQVTYDVNPTGGRRPRSVTSTQRDKLTAQALQQLPRGHALLIHASDPPATGRIQRHPSIPSPAGQTRWPRR